MAIDEVARGVPADGPPAPTLAALLCEEERRILARWPVRKRRVEWLAGRLAAKRALQHHTGAADWPRDAVVRKGPTGRPAFDRAWLSISHSRRHAMAAVADRAVGVDTETFDALRAESLASLLRPGEVRALRQALGCDALAARTLLWCLKEALFKAAGEGGFVRFAQNLDVLGWSTAAGGLHWRWRAPCEPGAARPRCDDWRAAWGLFDDAAWVRVTAVG